MSVVDPIITSALIGLAGVIGGYAIQNYYSRKADREMERFKLKREKYEDLVKQLSIQIHLVKTMGGKTSDETKEKIDVIFNTLWLYGSDDVLRYLNRYVEGKEITDSFNKLLWAMRKDLLDTKIKESEVKWFQTL